MKRNLIIFFSFFMLVITGCEKESSGDNVLQGTFVPPYADVSTLVGKIDPPTKDSAVNFQFSIRSAVNKKDEKVTISYNVSGAVTLNNQTVVIDRNSLETEVPITIPGKLIVPPATGSVVITITKAVFANGNMLRLGIQGTTTDAYSYELPIEL